MARKRKEDPVADRAGNGGPALLADSLPTITPPADDPVAVEQDRRDAERHESRPAEQPTAGQEDVAAQDEPRQWGNPYRATFTSAAGGFEVGEDRRFKQVVFRFADRPDPEVTGRLKEAGYTYRPAERSWTVPASAAAREFAHGLATELHLLAGGTAQVGR